MLENVQFYAKLQSPLRVLISIFILFVAYVLQDQTDFSFHLSEIVFTLLTMLAFATVFGLDGFKALTGKIQSKDLPLVIGLIVLHLVISIILTLLLDVLNFSHASNTGAETLAQADVTEKIESLATFWIILPGEEYLIATVAFIMMAWFTKHLYKSTAITLSIIFTFTIFGLIHLPVYDWNIVQCLLVIGWPQALSAIAWFKTKSVMVPIVIHVLYDYVLFVLVAIGVG